MYAYSKLAPEKYANMTGSLDLNSNGNLVLYLGKDIFEIYPKVWDKDNIVVIKDGKRKKLKRKDLEKYNKFIVKQIYGKYKYVIAVNGEDSCVIYCYPTRKAEDFYNKHSAEWHSSHSSHTSHISHSDHASHYSSF